MDFLYYGKILFCVNNKILKINKIKNGASFAKGITIKSMKPIHFKKICSLLQLIY